MELITILNRCHRFRGFIYQQAHFSADKKSIEVAVRPRKGSVAICSRCHLPAPGYDQLGERRFEFIPLWGFLVFLLYTMRRVDCRRCGVVTVEEVPWGDGKRTLTKAYMLFLARWARRLSWKETAEASTFLASVVVLLVAAVSLFYFKLVTVKMLPFDNKSEFQVIVDMPNGTTLEQTQHVANTLAREAMNQPEVVNVQTYAGTASPFNFNGLVRHYYLRRGSNIADLQVNLMAKGDRSLQSHDIAKQVRDRLQPVGNRFGARVKVAEVPPGPPVLETLVAEVYGPSQQGRIAVARQIRSIFQHSLGVVDTDWYVEDEQCEYRVLVDREKAALNGVTDEQIARTIQAASAGYTTGLLHADTAKEDIPIVVRLARAERSSMDGLRSLRVAGASGHSVPLSELTRTESGTIEKSIYHKNLLPVTYVTADVAGAVESPGYAIFNMMPEIGKVQPVTGGTLEQFITKQPEDLSRYSAKWDGEAHITYEVFRDLGLAFAAVLILIYALVVGWFKSFVTPLIIMVAIPFSLVGILPGHGLLHAFFTATSMIGFIAGAGIVVRNSIILVDFIELRLREGMPLDQAVIDAGAVRFRPMALTAAAVVVGSAVILFDPIFQGLAIALMAGEIASLALSRMTVPIVYFLFNSHRRGVVTN